MHEYFTSKFLRFADEQPSVAERVVAAGLDIMINVSRVRAGLAPEALQREIAVTGKIPLVEAVRGLWAATFSGDQSKMNAINIGNDQYRSNQRVGGIRRG